MDPEVTKAWNLNKNGDVTPGDVVAGETSRMSWKVMIKSRRGPRQAKRCGRGGALSQAMLAQSLGRPLKFFRLPRTAATNLLTTF